MEGEEKEQADSKLTPAAKKVPEVAGGSPKCAAQTAWLDPSSFESRKQFIPLYFLCFERRIRVARLIALYVVTYLFCRRMRREVGEICIAG